MRPKTAYYADDGEAGSGSSATISGEHVISYPVPPGTTFSGKSFKQGKEKKKVKLDRSATFKGKEKEKERERERQAAAAAAANASSGVDGGEGLRVPEQQIVECVTKMKEALEEMMVSSQLYMYCSRMYMYCSIIPCIAVIMVWSVLCNTDLDHLVQP